MCTRKWFQRRPPHRSRSCRGPIAGRVQQRARKQRRRLVLLPRHRLQHPLTPRLMKTTKPHRAVPTDIVPLDVESAAAATQPAHQPPGPPLPPPERPTTGTKTIDPLMLGPQPRPKPPPAKEVPVVCRLCGTRMYAPLAKIGQTMQCPDCHSINDIVGPKKPPPPKQPPPSLDDAPDFGLGEAVERPAYRPVVAPRGEYAELAEFDPEQRPAGWSRPERMTSTAASATAVEEEEDDEEIVVSAPVERLEIKPDIKPLPPPDPQDDLYDGKYDDGLIGDWDDRKKPQAWKRAPLTIGILSFPFQLQSLLRIFLYGAGLAMFANLVHAGIAAAASSVPSAQAGAMLASIVITISGFFLGTSLAAVLFAIVQDTANGSDETTSYPDWNFVEWIGTALYFPAAAFMAGLPGSVFTVGMLGMGLDPTFGAYAVVAPLVLSWVAFFPFVIYSMLAEGSIMAPLSSATSKSIHEAPEGLGFLLHVCHCHGNPGLGGVCLCLLETSRD